MDRIEAGWPRLEALVQALRHHGFQRFERDVRRFMVAEGWNAVAAVEPPERFRRDALRFFLAPTKADHAVLRRARLVGSRFEVWIHRCGSGDCAVVHAAFDRLVLPPHHHFWRLHSPPRRHDCSGYVSGASLNAGIRACGGAPERPLPLRWDQPDPETGAILGARPPFDGDDLPNLRTIFLWAFGT